MYLKIPKSHWSVGELLQNYANPAKISPTLLHIIKTTSLLESRADLYSDYLRSLSQSKGNQWLQALEQWNLEESQHGQALAGVAMKLDKNFYFSERFEEYTTGVYYHDNTGKSVRGSIANEMIARCTVEALASGYYYSLLDDVTDPTIETMLRNLKRDEARHFGMFAAMLNEEEQHCPVSFFTKLRVMLGRMTELGDDQISYASYVASSGPRQPYNKRKEANLYVTYMYGRYRYKHMHYVFGMLFHILSINKRGILLVLVATLALFVARCRVGVANTYLYFHDRARRQ